MRAGRELKRSGNEKPTESTSWGEFEVQAYLWSELRRIGLNARGEVKTRFANRAYVRFDIAVFQGEELVGILETKAAKVNHKTSWEDTRQGTRYVQFGVPVRLVYGMDQAEEAVEDARNDELWHEDRCIMPRPWRGQI